MLKVKKGQLSIEIMYSVGVMMMIFVIITGITFQRKVELRRTEEFINKRDDCLKIANTMTGLDTNGDQSSIKIKVYNYADISVGGLITVTDQVETGTTIDAFCTHNTRLYNNASVTLNQLNYEVKNENGTIRFIAL